MKLRNADLALVEREKIVGYLLNGAHPDNGGKAKFFESLGYSISDPDPVAAALRAIAQNGEVMDTATSAHGEKYCRRMVVGAH